MTSPEKSFARRFRSSNSDRAGGSVVEAIVALALGLFVVQLCLTTAAQVRRSALRLADRQEVLVSLRIVRHVLRSELGHADATRDWSVAGDSLWLRAFRGTGLVCPDSPSPSEWVVAYRGERPPDPSKDSVEVTYPDGAVLYADLTGIGSASESCGVPDPTEVVSLWRIDPPLPAGPILVRVFERGSYHFSGSALRYRRGGGGRQPLTPEVWSDARTGWRLEGGRLSVELTPVERGVGPPWTGFLAWIVTP